MRPCTALSMASSAPPNNSAACSSPHLLPQTLAGSCDCHPRCCQPPVQRAGQCGQCVHVWQPKGRRWKLGAKLQQPRTGPSDLQVGTRGWEPLRRACLHANIQVRASCLLPGNQCTLWPPCGILFSTCLLIGVRRYVTDRDPVAMVPPGGSVGFRHVGNEVSSWRHCWQVTSACCLRTF